MQETCPICGDSGLRIVEQPDGQRFAQPCTCRVERRATRLLDQARIPRRYELCSLDSYETMHKTANPSIAKALRISRKFAEGYPIETAGKGLLFTGSSGLGKTHLSVSILKTLIAERGATGVFWEHKELLDELRSIYSLRTAGAEGRLLKSVTT